MRAQAAPTQMLLRDFVLLDAGKSFWQREPYHELDRVNGTGELLSAELLAEIGMRNDVVHAIRIACRFTNQAIGHPIPVGHKTGPINHWANQIVYPQQ